MKSPEKLSFDVDITYDVGDYTVHLHRVTVGEVGDAGKKMKTKKVKHCDCAVEAAGLSEQAKRACKNFELSQKFPIRGGEYY